MNNLMKFKEYSFCFYLCSIIIVLINIILFPNLLNSDLNLIDSIDYGHSKYLESVLSNYTNISEKLDIPIINESIKKRIIVLQEINSIMYL